MTIKGWYTDSRGRKRPLTSRRRQSLAAPTLFSPPKSKKYSEIVRIDTPAAARESSRKLLSEYKDAKTHSKRVRLKRYTVLAANRADVMAKNKRLSSQQRAEAREVTRIYRRLAERMRTDQRE